jgi:hypothetical protein
MSIYSVTQLLFCLHLATLAEVYGLKTATPCCLVVLCIRE